MEDEPKWLRIAELERLAGIPRRTIHFYVQEKLLHPPVRTGKTMAYYDDAHVQKLRFIRDAKKEGMPLVAIREKIAELENTQIDAFGLRNTKHQSMQKITAKDPKKLPRKERGIQTREKILDLACRIFREKGYKETKVSDITKELNIGKGTFYFYFTDKRELLLECAPRIFSEEFTIGWERLRQIENPMERIKFRTQLILPVLKEFCTILQIAREAMEDPSPKIKQLGEQIFLSIRRPIEKDFEMGIQQGIFKPLNPKIISTFMIGITQSFSYLQSVDNLNPNEAYDQEIMQHLFSAISIHPK